MDDRQLGAEIIRRLLPLLRGTFRLDWKEGIHGAGHWTRVYLNGLALARSVDVNPRIPAYFAYLHDLQREHDGHDVEHGAHAAAFSYSLRKQGYLSGISNIEFDRLHHAMCAHSDGTLSDDPIVQVCWDADRLDIGRCRLTPDRKLLSTPLARSGQFLMAAYARSRGEPAASLDEIEQAVRPHLRIDRVAERWRG